MTRKNPARGNSIQRITCTLRAQVTAFNQKPPLKICGDDVAAFERFFLALNEITEKNNIHCVMTASLPTEDVPASLASFIRDAH